MREIIALIEAGDLEGAQELLNRGTLSGEEAQIVSRTLARARERVETEKKAKAAKPKPEVESSELPEEKPKPKAEPAAKTPQKKSSQKGKK